jgi:hypothetical protein
VCLLVVCVAVCLCAALVCTNISHLANYEAQELHPQTSSPTFENAQ